MIFPRLQSCCVNTWKEAPQKSASTLLKLFRKMKLDLWKEKKKSKNQLDSYLRLKTFHCFWKRLQKTQGSKRMYHKTGVRNRTRFQECYTGMQWFLPLLSVHTPCQEMQSWIFKWKVQQYCRLLPDKEQGSRDASAGTVGWALAVHTALSVSGLGT